MQAHNIDIKAQYLSNASKNFLRVIHQYNHSIKNLFYCLNQKNTDVDNIYTMLFLCNSKLIDTAKKLINCKEYDLKLSHTKSKI